MALGFGAWRFDLKMALSTNKYLQDIPKSLRDEDDLSKVGLSSFEKTVDAIGKWDRRHQDISDIDRPLQRTK